MSEKRKDIIEEISLSTPLRLKEFREEGQVIIHGYAAGHQKIQLQKETALGCYDNFTSSKLIFSFGIATYPEYSEGIDQSFTLIFEQLPDDCTSFNLQSVPDGGSWNVYDFERNKEDLYHHYL